MLYSVSMDFEQMLGFRHKIDQKTKPSAEKNREKALKTIWLIRQMTEQNVDAHGGYSPCYR